MRFKAPENRSIHDLIFEEFDVDLPIESGTGVSVDDAIIMNIDVDYVHNEYVVLEYLGFYRFVDWKVLGQKLLCCGDKRFDCITISVSDVVDKSEVWTEEFFFDVGMCLGDTMVEMK